MKLEEMQKIAEARTKGEWYSGNLNIYLGSQESVSELLYEADNGPSASEANNDFIAMAANHIDGLLKLAEAVKNWAKIFQREVPHSISILSLEDRKLIRLVEELEE